MKKMKQETATQNRQQREGQPHTAHAVSSTRTGLIWSLALTGSFFLFELIVGLRVGSVALIADAAHNFSAAAGVGIALLGSIFASRPPSATRTFGYLKLEIFTAWINGAILLIMAGFIFKMGIGKLLNPTSLQTTPMFILAGIGLIIGGIPAAMLWQKQKTDVNVRGAFWHVMETVFGSAAVLLAAITVRFTGWLQADAVLGMLLGPVLIAAAWGIVRGSTKTLLDLSPEGLDVLEVKRAIGALPGVNDIHHVHAWSVGIGRTVFTAHVRIAQTYDPLETLRAATQVLKQRFHIYFSTLQVETECVELPADEIDFG